MIKPLMAVVFTGVKMYEVILTSRLFVKFYSDAISGQN